MRAVGVAVAGAALAVRLAHIAAVIFGALMRGRAAAACIAMARRPPFGTRMVRHTASAHLGVTCRLSLGAAIAMRAALRTAIAFVPSLAAVASVELLVAVFATAWAFPRPAF